MIVTIISVVVSAIITYVIARWQMKRNKIVHFSISSNDIGKGLSSEFPEFHLTYKNESLANDVEVLKGGFMNVGRNDIDDFNGKSDIQLILPEGSVLKAISVSPSSKELVLSANKDNDKDNLIHFGFHDKLMKDEFYYYTAIVEVNKETNNLHDNLHFRHRIKNTEKIKNVYIGQSYKKKEFISYKLFKFLLFFIYFILIIFCFYFNPVSINIIEKQSDKVVSVYKDPFSNLYLWKSDPISMNKISFDEFNSNYSFNPILHNSNQDLIIRLLLIISLSILLYVMYDSFWGKNRHIIYVLKKQINNDSIETSSGSLSNIIKKFF